MALAQVRVNAGLRTLRKRNSMLLRGQGMVVHSTGTGRGFGMLERVSIEIV